jgi:hypothetical protein
LTPTSTPFVYPSLQPQNAGMSPLVIGLIVVVVAVVIIVPLTFMFRSRSPKRESLLEKEPMPYRQDPYSQPPAKPTNQPTSPYNPPTSRYSSPTTRYEQSSSRYSQAPAYSRYSAKPTVTDRYSSPSSNVQQPTSGRTCPHCKRTVSGDYSVCPYCFKKMR